VGVATGAVAGLVGITPATGFVTPVASILIGAITTTACFFALNLKAKLQFDDSLDTFGVHGVGGTIGALLTAVFATSSVNPILGKDAAGKILPVGVLDGHPSELLTELIAIGVTYVIAGVGTFLILKLLSLIYGIKS